MFFFANTNMSNTTVYGKNLTTKKETKNQETLVFSPDRQDNQHQGPCEETQCNRQLQGPVS